MALYGTGDTMWQSNSVSGWNLKPYKNETSRCKRYWEVITGCCIDCVWRRVFFSKNGKINQVFFFFINCSGENCIYFFRIEFWYRSLNWLDFKIVYDLFIDLYYTMLKLYKAQCASIRCVLAVNWVRIIIKYKCSWGYTSVTIFWIWSYLEDCASC